MTTPILQSGLTTPPPADRMALVSAPVSVQTIAPATVPVSVQPIAPLTAPARVPLGIPVIRATHRVARCANYRATLQARQYAARCANYRARHRATDRTTDRTCWCATRCARHRAAHCRDGFDLVILFYLLIIIKRKSGQRFFYAVRALENSPDRLGISGSLMQVAESSHRPSTPSSLFL